jgi:hypothetical protein
MRKHRAWTVGTAIAGAMLVLAAAGQADPSFEWIDIHDGGGLYRDEGTVVLTDPDGHLLIGGESHDGVAGADMLVRKLNRLTHAEIWSTRFPAYDGNDMELEAMAFDPFGDVLVGGYIAGCLG